MKKKLFFIFPLFCFLLFSCQKKEPFTVYISRNLYKILWDYDEKYWLALKEFRDSNQKDAVFLDIGGSFSQKRIENRYTKGKDISQLFSFLNYDAVILDDSVLDINSQKMSENLEILKGKALSSNLYWKKGQTPPVLSRNIVLESSGIKFGLVSAIIEDFDKLDRRFYTSDYKIENPLYEINRNISRIRKNVRIIMLILKIPDSFRDDCIKKLEKMFYMMPLKPDIIVVLSKKYFKPLKFKKSRVVFIVDNEDIFSRLDINISNNFKLKSVSVKQVRIDKMNIPYKKTAEVDKIISSKKKVLDYFNKKISYSSEELINTNGGKHSLGYLISYSIKNYIKCNAAFYDYSYLKKEIKKGDITIKDVYEMLEDDDHLIYAKVRGRDLVNIVKSLSLRKVSFSGIEYNTLSDGKMYVAGKPLKEEVIYRIIIPQSVVKNDTNILGLATEFSVLPRKTIDAVMWYFRTHKDVFKALE